MGKMSRAGDNLNMKDMENKEKPSCICNICISDYRFDHDSEFCLCSLMSCFGLFIYFIFYLYLILLVCIFFLFSNLQMICSFSLLGLHIYLHYSFIFSALSWSGLEDPEPILGIPGVRWANSPQIHCRASPNIKPTRIQEITWNTVQTEI